MRAILLVERDGPARAARAAALRDAGFDVAVVGTGRRARDHVELEEPDLVIVEHELEDCDGRALARQFHVWPACPLIVISASATAEQVAACLDDGADDVVPTSIPAGVLAARVRVQLRHAAAGAGVVEQVLDVGDVRLDSRSYEVEIAGRLVQLSRQQMTLLRILMYRAGRLCTFELLSRALGRESTGGGLNAVRIGVSRLRRILGDGPRRPRIVAERGGGYRLIAPV